MIDVFSTVAAGCAAAGLDLAQPLAAGWYDRAVEPSLRLPDLGGPDRLAILLGNTRELWPHFVDWLRQDPARAERPDPLERYVVGVVEPIVAALPSRAEVRYAHEPPPRRVAIQRLAELAGLAWLSPANLSIHPRVGPWLSLRAVVVVDVPGPPGPPPGITRPCHACETAEGCEAAFRRALAVADPRRDRRAVETSWPVWLAVRDACPVGRAWRYQDEHLRYGYTKDPSILVGLARGS